MKIKVQPMNLRTELNKTPLSHRDEVLLSRYYDNELSWYGRWKCTRLISSHPAAEDFIQSLTSVGSQVEEACSKNTATFSKDLWNQISRRIDAEERAALYLGSRRVEHSDSKNPWMSKAMAWSSISGAVTAAVLITVYSTQQVKYPIFQAGESDQFVDAAKVNSSTSSFTNISTNLKGFQGGSARRRMQQQSVPLNAPLSGTTSSPLQVDWMRGEGPLRVIQQTQDQGAIIWVKRPRVMSPSSVADGSRKRSMTRDTVSTLK